MVRVVHYGLSANTGGIETYLLRLTQHIDRARFQFDFVHNKVGPPCFHDELTTLGGRFYGITPRRTSLRKNRRDLDELFDRERFDILHCHLNTLSYVEPIRAALRHNCKVLVHSHNSGASRSLVTNLLHRVHFVTLPRERVTMVAVSQLAGNWLFGNQAQFEVINNGIEVDTFAFRQEARDRIRRQMNLEHHLVAGNVGAFLPAKNHDFLLHAFRDLASAVPNATLLLVGLGPLESQIRSQISQLGLTDNVILLGRRDDVPDLLSAMDFLIFPSLYEGFPLAVLEAQASGLPCFIADTITDEVVVSPGCRRLPLAGGPQTWARAITATGANPNRLAGRDAVTQAGFSVAAIAERIQSVYLELMNR